MPAHLPTHLTDLLQSLEQAVLDRDRAQAESLAQQLRPQIAELEPTQRSALEHYLDALLAELETPPVKLPQATARRLFSERGSDKASAQGVVYPVWFATNRRPNSDGSGFTNERADQITRGRAEVYIPEAHRFGEIGNSFWTRLLRFDLRDDHLRLQQVTPQEQAAFFAELQQAMAQAREQGGPAHALFFLHGFNVSFAEAAIRAAQLGVDLKVPGATAFFSWPSRGSVAAYTVDEATIQASEQAIADFLVEFCDHCGADKVHLIAHSMGNRGLLRAMQRIAGDAELRTRVKLGQIFLAAPDVDRSLFLDLATLYPHYAQRTTLYSSNGDLPVYLSFRLHDAPRAGYYEPYTVVPGIDTIAVPNLDVDLLGHSYFAEAEALLHDIYDLMRNNTPPNQRQRLVAATAGSEHFWRLQR